MKESFKKLTRDNRGRFSRSVWGARLCALILAILALLYIYSFYKQMEYKNFKFVSPIVESKEIDYKVTWLTDIDESVRKAIPNMVEMSAERFTTSAKQKNFIMYQLFCLLREESYLGETKTCGDSGKSCGFMQFKEATYNRIRKEMIKKGLVEELGNRFSPFYSIETTAYALTQGYGKEWGPIARKKCI